MTLSEQTTKIIELLGRSIFGITVETSQIRFVFILDNQFLPIDACRILSDPEKYIPFIFNSSLFNHSLCNTYKEDIYFVVLDLRHNINNNVLLNASKDNTNFVFEVIGNMDDDKMNHFNSLFTKRVVKGVPKLQVATAERMQYLHDIGCDLIFIKNATSTAKENLIKCGGIEMPLIVSGLLKKYYYENFGSPTTIEDVLIILQIMILQDTASMI